MYNVVQVKLRTTVNQLEHHRYIALHERLCLPLNKIKELAILEQRHFDCFRDAAAPVAYRQSFQKMGIVEYKRGRREGAQKILPAKGIDAILDPYPRVTLRQYRRWHPDQPNAPMRRRCGISHHVKYRPTANDHHIRMPTNPMQINSLLHHCHIRRIV